VKVIDSPIKKELLVSLDYFHGFCEKNNLTYYLLGGTLIGAVRHKGFIPWDDDIDVGMPRKDYDRLLSLRHKVTGKFDLKHYSGDSNYIYPYIKLCNNGLIVQESFFQPFSCGVWIDIFPLDYTCRNRVFTHGIYRAIKALRVALIIRNGAFKEEKRSALANAMLRFLSKVSRVLPNRVLFALSDVLGRLGKNDKEYINYHGAWGIKESGPVNILSDRILVRFEGKEFYTFKNYDWWLTKVYGDYMALPPESQRFSEHYIVKKENAKN